MRKTLLGGESCSFISHDHFFAIFARLRTLRAIANLKMFNTFMKYGQQIVGGKDLEC